MPAKAGLQTYESNKEIIAGSVLTLSHVPRVTLHLSATYVSEFTISFSYQKVWYHQKEEVSHELLRYKFWFDKKDNGEYVWNKPDYLERVGKETPEATEITLGHSAKKWDE